MNVFACLLWCGIFGVAHGIYDTDVLVNISLIFVDYYPNNCIKLIHKTNISDAQSEQVFQVFKALASRIKETVGVYSYDLFKSTKKNLEDIAQRQQNCLNPAKYVIGEEDSAIEFSRLSNSIPMGNGAWLVILNSSVTEFFSEAKTPFNCEIIAAKIKSRERVEFREVYRVDDDYPLRIYRFGLWTSEKGLEISKIHLYARRSNLEGKLLRAGSIENWPMSSFENGKWDGFFPRIWKELEKLINCTTENYRSVDNATGVLRTNGSWNGLVGMVLRGEIDVIVSETTMNYERASVLRFSRPVLISHYQVFFCALGSNLKWSAVLQPFSRDTWWAVCAWIASGTLTISICFYCMRKYEECDEDEYTPVVSFFFIIQSLCQQGYPNLPRVLSCKIVFITSYLLSAVLIPSYSAWLIYSLTHHTPNKPFNSFEEFLAVGRYDLNVIRNSAEQTYFKVICFGFCQIFVWSLSFACLKYLILDCFDQKSMNALLRMVYAKVKKNKLRVQSVKEGLERTLCDQSRQAFFGVEATVKMYLQQSTLHSCCHIVTFARPLSPVFQCLAFLKGSPYSELINYKLQRLFTTGIIENIQKNFKFKSHRVRSYKEVEVGIKDVFQIFILLVMGLCLSVGFFLIERCQAMRKCKKILFLTWPRRTKNKENFFSRGKGNFSPLFTRVKTSNGEKP